MLIEFGKLKTEQKRACRFQWRILHTSDIGNLMIWKRQFYSLCSLFHDETKALKMSTIEHTTFTVFTIYFSLANSTVYHYLCHVSYVFSSIH